MNDSALSISTKAFQPVYARAEPTSARAAGGKGPTVAPPTTEMPAPLGAPGNEAESAAAGALQANGLDKTQAVNPSQRAEQAANEDAEEKAALAPPGKGELEQAVESINDFLQSRQRSLEFSVDDNSGRTVIKVMDAERKEVIRQIPPETALELMKKLRDGEGMAATGMAERA